MLIVDDEESIREIVQEGLSVREIRVDAVLKNAEKALSLLGEKNYDIVLCDFNLAHSSGLQLLEQVREQKGSSSPRFIFITGELVDSSRIAEFSAKGAAIVQKPFRVPELAQVLASSMGSETSKVN